MGIYVKTPTGKEPLQKKVTASEIKEALGYTPADKNSVPENLDLSDVTSNDDTFYIVDKDDNVIAQIDKDGIHTTEIELGGGESKSKVKEHIDDRDIHVNAESITKALGYTPADKNDVPEIDLSEIESKDDTFYIVDSEDRIIAQIDGNGLHIKDIKIGTLSDEQSILDLLSTSGGGSNIQIIRWEDGD